MFGCLRSAPFWLAASIALPAAVAFALAARAGVPLRTVASPWTFLLLYPVLEELVFRGLLQDGLQRSLLLARTRYGINGANLLAAAAFAMAHLLYQPLPWAIAVFLPGLVFGWAYTRYGRVVAPILLHIAYNAAVIVGIGWSAS